ncbi:MAG: AbrB/MazE/SpoVT family DNA-binding domain-containing protein [Candidatus Diapherotrites archaeon]|nr:AbrB/MazE/SpoVT family DNA-binding domain-containing protein [Candidatus Diapherotrites archaeon]
MRDKCHKCGAAMKLVDDIGLGGFMVKGYRCGKCGEEVFNANEVAHILKFNKAMKRGLSAKVFKSGNSIAVRLPMELVSVYHLEAGKELKIRPEKHGIELVAEMG